MKRSPNNIWKRSFYFILCMLIFCGRSGSAQDTLTLVTGAKLIVIIKELTNEHVVFSLWPDSLRLTKLPLDRVQSSSKLEGINNPFLLNPEEEKALLEALPADPEAIRITAINDANSNYKNSSGAGGGTFLATVLGTPLVGLLVAIPASVSPPPEIKLNPPDRSLFKNPEYYAAYKKQAHKIKQRKIWTGFGMGVVVDAVVLLFIAHEMSQMDYY